MTDPIMPEIEQARSLLADIGWNDVAIRPVTGGTVNRTYQLARGTEAWYLRIGPTEAEVGDGPTWFTTKGLRREQQAIAHWSNHSRYFPETVHTDFSRSTIDSDWVIQKAIPGEPWSAMHGRLTRTQSASLWQQLGALIAELHSYVGTEFGGMEPGNGFTRWSELVRWDATGLLTDAHRYELPVEPFAALCELVDRSTDELDEIDTPRLVHSDLGSRHVIIDRGPDGEPVIAGLIDLEFARFADPYSESLFVQKALDPQDLPEFDHFLDAYGGNGSDRAAQQRSLIYQLTALAWWVTDAMRRGQPVEARETLARMRDRVEEENLTAG